MSSLAPAPSGGASETTSTARAARRAAVLLTPDVLTAVALAAALALLVFVTTGGTTLAQSTWAEIVLVLIGSVSALAVLRRPGAPGRNGLPTLLAFGGFSALTALSIVWSVMPDQSWLEANRMIAYLAAIGSAIALVRLWGDRWRGVIGAIAIFAVGLSSWALLSKVFPAALAPTERFGRLRGPFHYWNAVGLVASMGLPPLIWAGGARDGGPWRRAIAVPAIGILLTTLILSYSRSALLATVCGVVVWFAFVPLRLRGAATLALGALAGAGPTLWALHTHALTRDGAPLAPRVDAGDGLGVLLVLMVVVFTAVGLAGAYLMDRSELTALHRRRIGVGLIVAVALVPAGALGAAAVSSRGLTGEISQAWHSLVNTNGSVSDTPGRLVALGNTRALYWSEGLALGEHHPLIGVGAGSYAVARTRYTTNRGIVAHAHSFLIQTFAELGALGLLMGLGLFVVWGREVLRTLGRGPKGLSLGAAERTGLLTLTSVVVVFGAHATVDWTWDIPGTAVPALLCAGWLAGRTARGPSTPRGGRSLGPGTAPALAVLVAVSLLAAWAIWQPLRSSDAVAAAENALLAGHGGQALTDARIAVARNPLSSEPLQTEADVLTAIGDAAGARATLVQATMLQPQNPATWRSLGVFDLSHGHAGRALGSFARSHQLDPTAAITDTERRQAQLALAHGPGRSS